MLARVTEGLSAAELTRAHYITAFFWLGFESGHRLRRLARQGFTQPHYIRYVAEQTTHPGVNVNDPFFVGWCQGWKFEPEKSR